MDYHSTEQGIDKAQRLREEGWDDASVDARFGRLVSCPRCFATVTVAQADKHTDYHNRSRIMAAAPKYPNVEVQLSGLDGNAMTIMGRTRRALRNAGVSKEEIDAYSTEARSGDYDNVLLTTMAWVETS